MTAALAPQVTPAAGDDERLYQVRYGAERLECSCLAGRMTAIRQAVGVENPKACRHLVAVVDFEQERTAATSNENRARAITPDPAVRAAATAQNGACHEGVPIPWPEWSRLRPSGWSADPGR